MGYNPSFRLNPEQLELIEDALRSEIGRLVEPIIEEQDGTKYDKHAVREITELLGHLHHQKWWHQPKQAVPMG